MQPLAGRSLIRPNPGGRKRLLAHSSEMDRSFQVCACDTVKRALEEALLHPTLGSTLVLVVAAHVVQKTLCFGDSFSRSTHNASD